MYMTAPGDMVRGQVTVEHAGWARGELREIAEPSPHRVDPVCPLYGSCGGCSLQHLSYEAQIDVKAGILREAFKRIGGIGDLPELTIARSPPYEYRNRVQLHCLPEVPALSRPAGAVLGFKGRKSGRIVPASDCPVADPGIRSALGGNAALERGIRLPPDRKRFTLYSRFDTFLQEGQVSRGTVRILDKELLLDAGVFFQSNGIMLEALIADLERISRGADLSLPMADIYAGVGTFTAFLGGGFPGVDLVEENRTALDIARKNAPGRGRRFFALRENQWVEQIRQPGGRGKGGIYGFAVADPPRQGLSKPLRRWLCEAGPPLFAYVSCDPATLARDSGELLRGSYGLSSLGFYDFYPQTAHIESLAVFERKGA
jgi:23S rRNA (uracil1939-C5)-methyltransferase